MALVSSIHSIETTCREGRDEYLLSQGQRKRAMQKESSFLSTLTPDRAFISNEVRGSILDIVLIGLKAWERRSGEMLLDTEMIWPIVICFSWIVRHSVGCFFLFVLLDLLFLRPVGFWST